MGGRGKEVRAVGGDVMEASDGGVAASALASDGEGAVSKSTEVGSGITTVDCGFSKITNNDFSGEKVLDKNIFQSYFPEKSVETCVGTEYADLKKNQDLKMIPYTTHFRFHQNKIVIIRATCKAMTPRSPLLLLFSIHKQFNFYIKCMY